MLFTPCLMSGTTNQILLHAHVHSSGFLLHVASQRHHVLLQVGDDESYCQASSAIHCMLTGMSVLLCCCSMCCSGCCYWYCSGGYSECLADCCYAFAEAHPAIQPQSICCPGSAPAPPGGQRGQPLGLLQACGQGSIPLGPVAAIPLLHHALSVPHSHRQCVRWAETHQAICQKQNVAVLLLLLPPLPALL